MLCLFSALPQSDATWAGQVNKLRTKIVMDRDQASEECRAWRIKYETLLESHTKLVRSSPQHLCHTRIQSGNCKCAVSPVLTLAAGLSKAWHLQLKEVEGQGGLRAQYVKMNAEVRMLWMQLLKGCLKLPLALQFLSSPVDKILGL